MRSLPFSSLVEMWAPPLCWVPGSKGRLEARLQEAEMHEAQRAAQAVSSGGPQRRGAGANQGPEETLPTTAHSLSPSSCLG